MKQLWFKMKLGQKYGLALTVTVILFTLSSILVWVLLNNVTSNVNVLAERGDQAIELTEMGSLIRTKDILVADYMTFAEQHLLDEFEMRSQEMAQLMELVYPKLKTEHEMQIFNQIVENDEQINIEFLENMVPNVQVSETLLAAVYRNNIADLQRVTVDLLEELRELANNQRAVAIQNVQASITATISLLLASIIISVSLAVTIMFLINRIIKKALRDVIATSNEIANGNLAIEKSTYAHNDELGQLTKSTNIMVDRLREMVGKISTASGSLSQHSAGLNQSANEVNEGSQQIASTMQELSSGAESQATQASESADFVNSFMKKIKMENKSSYTLKSSSQEVLSLTKEGKELMTHSENQMQTVYQIIQDAVEKVKGLDQRSADISKLVKVINDVAEQTNLLALNAAIEAARAGEHGKGFAVVADEVRKLAEQVTNSISEITEIVQGVQADSQQVSTSLQTGFVEVENGAKQLKETGVAFETIRGNVVDIADRIESMTANLEEINLIGNSLSQSIESIAAVSEQSSAGIEQTAASVQQTSSTMDDITTSSDHLARLADELNEVVRAFKFK